MSALSDGVDLLIVTNGRLKINLLPSGRTCVTSPRESYTVYQQPGAVTAIGWKLGRYDAPLCKIGEYSAWRAGKRGTSNAALSSFRSLFIEAGRGVIP